MSPPARNPTASRRARLPICSSPIPSRTSSAVSRRPRPAAGRSANRARAGGTRMPEGKDPVGVLVVDDEEDFATAVADRLRRRGYRASAVCGGRDALRLVQATPFDVMVLDLKMPEMDGVEVLRAVRRLDPHLQVVVLTGHGTVAAAIDGMQLGASDFLQKPVAIETLCTVIEAVAERSRASRGSTGEE